MLPTAFFISRCDKDFDSDAHHDQLHRALGASITAVDDVNNFLGGIERTEERFVTCFYTRSARGLEPVMNATVFRGDPKKRCGELADVTKKLSTRYEEKKGKAAGKNCWVVTIYFPEDEGEPTITRFFTSQLRAAKFLWKSLP